jgi:hypothetical protein
MKAQISETSGNIAWLFDKIKNVDEQIKRYELKDEFMTMQFQHQKTTFIKELNDYLANQHYDLQVSLNQ